ncbi:G2/mitotic-specific cyclin cdc13 [Wickerhamomyces ciferrii]|uniref:G2/mitotic-specific cyclin cdc13 n=1 Tax=Wickerhamomyces ciferrii (strain ATCC 14091 / BCRC 22168 / CBS 111 / JCM 3599 / NBRC 0793 / NRRL Y-1031 F-60-10) TaxID=1206466 RepID=K0KNB5_WICCF|nr:G2/mitotic-specific cyclin cdc13 [Wickerhamomyces ciferrii]CCH42864.1 G2/mitotic-specific cyclin cdc13 [Wickerhamomyces ciferrii]
MVVENQRPVIQDENALQSNARVTRSKTSSVLDTKPSNTFSSLPQRRAALSNLTNSSSGVSKPKLTSKKSKTSQTQQQQQVQPTIIIEEDQDAESVVEIQDPQVQKQLQQQQQSRAQLKRSATESLSNVDEDESTKLKTQNNNKKAKIEYEWKDLDSEDADDPLMVSDYVDEIFEYLHQLEIETLPDSTYLSWQKNLKPKMRSILVDWIVEVHLRFRLLPETLFLAINIMDRFMSKESLEVDKLQLLATGSLFIAAKYEEVYSPSVKNYSYVTDGGYTEDEILEAERFILQVLKFNLNYPNPMNFLRRISKADDYDIQTRTIGKYLLEVTIMDHRFIGIKPSLCSAAAMYVSRRMLGRPDWDGTLTHYSGGYTKDDMKHVVELILSYLTKPVVHEEFFKKYASKKFMKSSILARQWAKKIEAECIDIMEDEE